MEQDFEPDWPCSKVASLSDTVLPFYDTVCPHEDTTMVHMPTLSMKSEGWHEMCVFHGQRGQSSAHQVREEARASEAGDPELPSILVSSPALSL